MKLTIIPVMTAANGTVTKVKKKFGSPNRNTFKRFTREDSHTWNIANNTGSTAG